MTQVKFTSPVAYQRGATLDSSMFYMGSLQSFLAKGDDTRLRGQTGFGRGGAVIFVNGLKRLLPTLVSAAYQSHRLLQSGHSKHY